MRKQLFLLFSFFLFTVVTANAQEDTTNQQCLTTDMDTTEFVNLPWFDNNQFIENFLDSIGYPAAGIGNRIIGTPQVRFWIPIKFWIYRDDNGNDGPDLRQIQRMIDDLNRLYNQVNDTRIGFYMKCDPTYINNSQHLDKTFVGASLLMAANKDDGSINVHVVNRLFFAAGMALAPLNACIVNRNAYLRDQATLAHEVGHVLGLVHTHLYSTWGIKCFTESISRTRTWPTFNLCVFNRIISGRVCESTGDALSDTQADPDLLNNFGCNYNLDGTDPWGDSYTNPPNGLQERPNTANIMSYANDFCQTQFSRLQVGVMLWTLYFKKTNNLGGWANPISTFDDFEPDNEAITARNIQINELQERNFHQQWNRIGGYGYTTQCDVDWVRFVAPCSSNFEVFTAAMPK